MSAADQQTHTPPLLLAEARPDLEIVEVDPTAEESYVVKDPAVVGAYYSFDDLQVALLGMLDGKTTIDEVQAKLLREHDVEADRQDVLALISNFASLGLLEPHCMPPSNGAHRGARAALKAMRKARLVRRGETPTETDSDDAECLARAQRWLERGCLVEAARDLAAGSEINPANERIASAYGVLRQAYARSIRPKSPTPDISLFDPKPLLQLLAPLTRRLFSRGGVVFMVSLCTVAAAIIAFRSREYQDETWRAVGEHVHWLPLTMALVIFLHELGHAVACYHYGGRPRQIGVMLILYIFPAAYTDTSDTYLFKNGGDKMVVYAAGTIGTLLIWAVGVIFWLAVTRSELTDVWLQFGFLTLTTSALNFFPLYKLDGYHLISVYVGERQLEESSLEALYSFLFRPLGELLRQGDTLTALSLVGVLNLLTAPFLVLLLVSDPLVYPAVFTIGMLSAALAVRSLRRRTEKDRGRGLCLWGATILLWRIFIIAFSGYVLLSVASRLGAVGAVLWFGWMLFMIPTLLLIPILKHVARRGASNVRGTLWALAAVAWLCVDLAVLYNIPWTEKLHGPAMLGHVERHLVRAEVAGRVAEVNAEEGQFIQRGGLLLRLENPDLERHVRDLELEQTACRAELRQLARGPEAAMRHLLSRRLASRRVQHQLAVERLDRSHALSGLLPQEEVRRLEATAGQQQEALGVEQSRATAATRVDSSRIEVLKAHCDTIEPRLGYLRQQVSKFLIRAPISGVVTHTGLERASGSWVKPSQPLLILSQPQRWEARASFEKDQPLEELAPGLFAWIYPESGSGRPLPGRVHYLAPSMQQGRLEVMIDLDRADAALRPGSAAKSLLWGASAPYWRFY